jgi:hypothetical protein
MVFMWKVCEATLAITMDTDKIILGLSILDAKYNALMQELINTYHFDGIRDVRVNMVKHPRIVIDSTYVLLLVRQDNLFEPSWWERMINLKKISKDMTQKDRDTFAFAYDSYVKSSYITMLLFAIESGFRSLYLSVFGKNAPFKFSDVYPKLLQKFGLDDYNNLLRLASTIRNTLHNNGQFNWPDESIPWGNKTYEFKQGQLLEIDYWETFIIITEDILTMLEKLIKQKEIIEKPQIVDASYNNI